MKRNIVVEQDAENPVEKKLLAQAIVDISKAVQRIGGKSGLNRKAIVILAAKSSQQPQYVVEAVLESLEQLQADYVQK